jgi:hypothetical protein
MLPHRDFGVLPLAAQVRNERGEGVGHMAIAFVPGFDPAAEHRAVVLFRIFYEPRVLLREEKFVVRDAAVAARINPGALAQLDELAEGFLFT